MASLVHGPGGRGQGAEEHARECIRRCMTERADEGDAEIGRAVPMEQQAVSSARHYVTCKGSCNPGGSKSAPTDSPSWMRRIASAKSVATGRMRILSSPRAEGRSGTVSVVTSSVMPLEQRRSAASPDRVACVQAT